MKKLIWFFILIFSINLALAATIYPTYDPYNVTLYYALDGDCTAAIGDYTCNPLNDTYTSVVSAQTPFGTGQALNSSGCTNYLNTSFNTGYYDGAWTVAFWYKALTFPARDGGITAFLEAYNVSPPVRNLFVNQYNNDALDLYANMQIGADEIKKYNGDDLPSGGGWNHIVVRHVEGGNASNLTVYINGTLLNIPTVDDAAINHTAWPDQLTIGGHHRNFYKMDGFIDEVMIWNETTLSPSQIDTLYQGNYSDTVKPRITIESPTNDTNTNKVNIYINGTATDNNETNITWINDSRFDWNGTADYWSFVNNTLLEEREWHFNISVNDSYNNVRSAQVFFTIDWTKPVISGTSPNNNSYHKINISYAGTCTDDNIYNFSIDLKNSSDEYHLKHNDTPVGSVLTLASAINITDYADGNYTLNWSCADSHTDANISNLKKGKKGETVFLVNESDDVGYNMSLYFIEKDDKLTDTPADIKSYLDYNEDNTRINFGINFTADKPETKPVFKIDTFGVDLKILSGTGYRGHLMWYPYGTDFEGVMYVNGEEKAYTVEVWRAGEVYVKIIPTENLAGNDEVEIKFESIFGLNIDWQEDKIVIDRVVPTYNQSTPNQTLSYGGSLNVLINASDGSSPVNYSINDTTNFQINLTNGTLTNKITLSAKLYSINVSASDFASNTNSIVVNVRVNPPATSAPAGGGGASSSSSSSESKKTAVNGSVGVCEPESLFHKIISDCRIPENEICDYGEWPLRDEDCKPSFEKLKSGDLLKEMWILKLSLMLAILFYLKKKWYFPLHVIFIISLLAMNGTFGEKVIPKPTVNEYDCIGIDFFTNMGGCIWKKDPTIGWMIVIGTGLLIFYQMVKTPTIPQRRRRRRY